MAAGRCRLIPNEAVVHLTVPMAGKMKRGLTVPFGISMINATTMKLNCGLTIGAVIKLYLGNGESKHGEAIDKRDFQLIYGNAASSGHEEFIFDIFKQNRCNTSTGATTLS